ncbi:MAG: protein translocase subunit SecD, partial [Planctomycetota bacterium]
MSLARSRLVRTLNLPIKRESLRDETGKELIDPVTGKALTKPSQRDVALQSLEAEFPHLADELDGLATSFDKYQDKRTGFDDPQDLIRLLRGAGVLEFHIAVNSAKPEGVNPDDLSQQLAERGPERTDSSVARWFLINDLKQWYDGEAELAQLEADARTFFANRWRLIAEEHEGQYYLLLYTSDAKSMTHKGGREWNIVQAVRDVDRLGRPAVRFRLDIPGGGMMSRLTGPHVLEPMAIVLDGQVYSAPTLQSQIGNTGIITGNFSESEINYLIRVLAAGSLQARLSPDPIAINTLGPSIGEDNLTRGLDACLIAIIAVAAFMMLYYFFAGMVADFALLANGVIIFGIMSLIDGTFTLPGLAGIVLTIGMAVDANVLIYERIREELFTDEVDLRGAIRQGYRKALSTIIDANVTNLIVCIVLFYTATTEVKGFALTLTIGICATLFTALFVTRVIYALYTDLARFRRLPMLPTVFPAVHRALEPDINWMGLRKFFWPLSVLAVAGSIMLVSSRGVDMFDTEFRGGVAVTMRAALVDPESGPEGDRYWLRHTGEEGVETRVQSIGRALFDPTPLETRQKVLGLLQSLVDDPDSPIHQLTADDLPDQLPRVAEADARVESIAAILGEMRNASVLTVGDTRLEGDAISATQFQIKVASPKGLDDQETITDAVVAAVVNEFGDQLDVTQPLDFEGAGSTNHAQYTYFIEKPLLGDNINRPQYKERVSDYRGGVAIVIDDVEPPATTDDIAKRIDRMRAQPDFANAGALGRE